MGTLGVTPDVLRKDARPVLTCALVRLDHATDRLLISARRDVTILRCRGLSLKIVPRAIVVASTGGGRWLLGNLAEDGLGGSFTTEERVIGPEIAPVAVPTAPSNVHLREIPMHALD
jgi:hypothetical protein